MNAIKHKYSRGSDAKELEQPVIDTIELIENYRKEKETIQDTQKAILNILDDYIFEKDNLEKYQKALLNTLDDYEKEKENLKDTQNALLNILDDLSLEKNQVDFTNKELILSNKELESFSYTVSHDLRAPVRSINGFINILISKYNHLLNEEGQEYLSIVAAETVRMGKLIDDLLLFSKLGKKEIQKSFENMNTLTAQAVEETLKSQENKYKGIIKIRDLHPAQCDKRLIYQVLINLISNAVKFSFLKDKPVIEIRSSEDDNMITYYVSDNGAGFDMKYADKLFGVFQRLHDNNEFPGIGIGLAIVQRIIIRHGGRVYATGEINKGATFCFSLPKRIFLDLTNDVFKNNNK